VGSGSPGSFSFVDYVSLGTTCTDASAHRLATVGRESPCPRSERLPKLLVTRFGSPLVALNAVRIIGEKPA
jgi:hypothetical protein